MMERPRFLKSSAGARTHAGRPLRQVVWGVVALCGLFVGLQVWWLVTATPTVAAGPRIIEIPPHLGVLDIARRLDKADIIRSPFGFALLALVQGKARALKAGEYEVPQGANTFAVLSLLEGGKVLYHPVLLKEGASLAELARAIEAEGLARADDVIRVGHDPIFLKMRAELTPELLKTARERGVNVHQLLTLASIIEREAVVPSELPLISAVFWNRLKIDMPLQADPTVQYATGKGRQPLTRDDLLVDHPYNTYRRPGLPPGPIANPGLLAIRAAVNPARVNYLYFVAMDERRHQFSQSLTDHNEAVARYRLGKLH